MTKLKTALVHEWLTEWGGSEKVLEAIYELYPSPVFILVKNEEAVKESVFSGAALHTSFIQGLPFSRKKYRNYLALFPLAIEQFDVSGFDLVISSSHAVAKGVLTTANQLHICYCHSPVRYAWDLYHQYLQEANLTKGFRARLAKIVLHYIRIWDFASSNRVDHFVANSTYIARRIKKIYNREATVIHPPVDVDLFSVYSPKEDYYLTASRMVPYKKINLVVEAFSRMPDRKLVVIGDGPDFKKIKTLATPNVELLGYQPFDVLKSHMQRAKAFVFAAEEDFGITPVEAQACGTPVIAFGKGGILDTVVPGRTGLFFPEQTPESLVAAIEEFERGSGCFKPEVIRLHAEKFSRERFIREFQAFVEEKVRELKK